MEPTYRRTQKGNEELGLHEHDLSPEQRKILTYANGRRSFDQLARLVPRLQRDPHLLLAMEDSGLLELCEPGTGQPVASGQAAGPTTAGDRPVSGRLEATKREIIEELSRVMGADASTAVERVRQVDSDQALTDLLPKLTEIVKLYAGRRAAESFRARIGR